MDWIDKEYVWESTYKSGRASQDIEKYIPKRLSEAISWVTVDCDGYWIYLNDGWEAYDGGDDCHTIHEYRICDLKYAINTIRRENVDESDKDVYTLSGGHYGKNITS